MSLFLLDTDILSLYQREHPVVSPRIDAVAAGELGITVISVEEQLTGWYSLLRKAKMPSKLAEAYQRLAESIPKLARFRIVSFTEPAMIRYGELSRQKLRVGKNDLRIAAITLEHGGIVVSRNLRDFQRVPGLTVEDWSV